MIVGPIVQSGTFALANFSSTPLLIIADMSIINVEVRVDETDIANVAVGQKAKIKVDALGEKELQGDVVEKAASAVTRSGQTIAQTAVAAAGDRATGRRRPARPMSLTNTKSSAARHVRYGDDHDHHRG